MPVMDRNVSLGDGGAEDLPRTLRRQREAQQRALEQKSATPPVPMHGPDWSETQTPQPAVVTAFEVPFFRLMLFYLKSVLAAVPAIILFGVILWVLGHLLMAYFPWLVKVQILIQVPK